MSREWKSGDVAVIVNRDARGFGRRAMFCDDNKGRRAWAVEDTDGTSMAFGHGEVRPLVVIDPEDREAVKRLADIVMVAALGAGLDHVPLRSIFGDEQHEIFATALREYANPKPPRPDEPKGLGAVVEDEDGVLWFRMAVENQTWPGEVWQEQYGDADRWSKWDSVAAVRVLSPGVEVDQ